MQGKVRKPVDHYLNVKCMLNGRPEISYTDCEEYLFEIAIKLSKERIYARLRSSKWEKPRHLREDEKKPLTERLLASSKSVLKTSTTPGNKDRLQEIVHNIEKLHDLYLDMEKARADVDTRFMKQVVRQASGLSSPAPSLEAALIASGISGSVASSNLIRRVDKLGRYWAACTTMAKLASNANYRTFFETIQLEPIPSYRAHVWPPGSKKKRHVHAEVQLVTHHRLHPSELPPRVIGVSKTACYLCDLFLSMHKQYYFSGSHGTIFEGWTVPDLLEYSSRDRAELRQTMVMVNRKLVTAIAATWRAKSKLKSTPKQNAYQSFIWSNPYQASTPPISIRDARSVAVSPRTVTPAPAVPNARTPLSLPQISQDEGDAPDNIPMQTAQAESQNQVRSARSSRGTIAPTTYTHTPPMTHTHTAVHGDSNGQNLVAEDTLPATSPLPGGNWDMAATAQPSHSPIPSTPTGSGARTMAQTDHIEVSVPPGSHPQLPRQHSYTASPSLDPDGPTAPAPIIHSLHSSSVSSSSEIVSSPTPKTLTPRRPLFTCLPGIDLYFSLEAGPALNLLAEPIISGATVAVTEVPSSALDVRSTCVDVAAMAAGEELVFEGLTGVTGGGLVEMRLRNNEGGGGGVRVVCEWSG